MEEEADPEVKGAELIAAAQRVEHYEMAGYGTTRAYAELLGDQEGAQLLETTLEEERQTDQKLSQVAKSAINVTVNARRYDRDCFSGEKRFLKDVNVSFVNSQAIFADERRREEPGDNRRAGRARRRLQHHAELDVYTPERGRNDTLSRPEVRNAHASRRARPMLCARCSRQMHTPFENISGTRSPAGLRIDHVLLSPVVAPRLVGFSLEILRSFLSSFRAECCPEGHPDIFPGNGLWHFYGKSATAGTHESRGYGTRNSPRPLLSRIKRPLQRRTATNAGAP